MPEDYQTLVTALKQSSVPFAEYAWEKRPDAPYGVVALEFEAGALNGDDRKVARAFEGSADLFTHGRDAELIAEIEAILESSCESCWRLESVQYEHESGLMHFEWVFQVEE